jgi:hypothetical protein
MPIDPLSELSHQLLKIDAEHAYEALLPKIPGSPDAKSILDRTPPPALIATRLSDLENANLLRSALYLWHDYLPEAHEIYQEINTPTCSFWHAIMHRREGDFVNSKHWYARCTEHPVLDIIAAQANPILNPLPFDKSILKLTVGGWNPDEFVDLVAEIEKTPDDPRRKIAVALQKLEWRVLFDHTARNAVMNLE